MGKNGTLRIDGQSPVGLRLAFRFWMELGRPSQFHNAKTLEAWSTPMESLFNRSGLDYERFKWFLIWLCRLDDPDGAKYGNDFTARNLRSARNPMASLVKQFPKTFFEIFLPKADKRIPLLAEKRKREDDQKAAKHQPEPDKRVRFVDILVADASEASVRNAQDLDRLDDAFPMLHPFPGESVEDWIDRESETLRSDNWRCPNCKYAFAIDGGDDARIKFCTECEEEKVMWAQDDWEWIHDREPEEVFRHPCEAGIFSLDNGPLDTRFRA